LIPTWFGCALIICGALAGTENARRRMLWMHIAVTIALFGFLFSGFMAIKEWVAAGSGSLAHPAAVQEQAVMSIVCFLLTALCVRSFITARRSRTA
jgi:heme/copper-type cytochrome/quinol oxidase subunit 3